MLSYSLKVLLCFWYVNISCYMLVFSFLCDGALQTMWTPYFCCTFQPCFFFSSYLFSIILRNHSLAEHARYLFDGELSAHFYLAIILMLTQRILL